MSEPKRQDRYVLLALVASAGVSLLGQWYLHRHPKEVKIEVTHSVPEAEVQRILTRSYNYWKERQRKDALRMHRTFG